MVEHAPDVRIEDAGFLADLSEKLLPSFPAPGLLGRIARVDVYGPPHPLFGIATIAVTARILRAAIRKARDRLTA